MKIIRMIALVLSLLPMAFANDSVLLKDMESLRDSLPFKDPGRPPLTRRLADLYFQKAVEDDKNFILSGKGNPTEITKMRERAGKLYREALDGEKGTYPAIEGELKIKIQFQLARLDRMNNERSRALESFQKITTSPNVSKQLMRETLFTIAEMYDEDGKWEKAQEAYQKSLPLCEGAESISYVHYRISWAYFRKGDVQKAQEEISLALYDASGNPKDQVIGDYIQFLAAEKSADGKTALLKIEPLSKKTGRPQIIEELGNAFFAAGNREAGVTVYALAHRQNPAPFFAARLAEEYYGFKQWDDVTASLQSLMSLHQKVAALEPKQRDTVDQILRRLVIQLDGERKSNPGKFQAEVLLAIDVYLATFPKNDVTQKMREGWLAAQSDDQQKMQRLVLWEKMDQGQPSERIWRQERAALALKLKDYKIIREEAQVLAQTSDEKVKREWTYIGAKAALDAGDENAALVTFKELAKNTQSPDKWAIQSQHLALDILNRSKRYEELAAQAALWTSVASLKSGAAAQDVLQMDKARQEALFENATSKGETPEALSLYMQYCQDGLFVEKSCANAKVLAIKLKKQAELVRVLEIQKDDVTLSQEYERMGKFAAAAQIQERALKPQDSEMQWMKVALLYQMGNDETGRVRVLRTLAQRLQKQGKMSPEVEALAKATYFKSGLPTTELIRLPWSASNKIKLAAQLETDGKGDAQTQKLLVSSKEDLGPIWAEKFFAHIKALDDKQKSVSFYGNNSSARFQTRLKLLGQMAEQVKAVLASASVPVRAYLLDRLSVSYLELDKEILASPLPQNLTAEQMEQVKLAMEEIASPIRSEGQTFAAHRDEQLSSLTDKDVWIQRLSLGAESVIAALKESAQKTTPAASGMTAEARQATLEKLALDPNDRSSLEKLRDDYTAKGESAPAAYFIGRLAEMEKL